MIKGRSYDKRLKLWVTWLCDPPEQERIQVLAGLVPSSQTIGSLLWSFMSKQNAPNEWQKKPYVIINEFRHRCISIEIQQKDHSLGPSFYTHRHCIFWWNNLSLNILKHFVQNIFFSNGIKHFSADEISAQVSFFLKVNGPQQCQVAELAFS